MKPPHKELAQELVNSEQFLSLLDDFLSPYIKQANYNVRQSLKKGDMPTANYQCGALEVFETLHDKLVAYSKRTFS